MLKYQYQQQRQRTHLISCMVFFVATWLILWGQTAHAVQLDWSGQFWFENQWLNNYQLDRSRPGYDSDPVYYNTGGPYVPGAGEKNVLWYSAFLKLRPKIVVNDSIHIKSEWQVGSPIYGFMGRDFPQSGGDQYNFTGSQKNGATITATRFWASLITDFGTIDLGRAPIHWGLGAMWNSGDNLFDRYQSTGDMIRLTSKFGNLSISPALSKVSMGNSAAGALSTTASYPSLSTAKQGNDDVTDYHLALRYDNSEEDFDFGLMWTRRTGNAAQSSLLISPTGSSNTRLNYNLLDFFVKKKFGHFTFGGEVPYFTGRIGGIDGSSNEFEYKSVAIITEIGYASDQWDILFKGGHVPGQGTADYDPNASGSTTAYVDTNTKYKAVYLNKDYGLGLIMFHYNLWGLGASNPDTLTASQLRSPYDNPIVNANYLALTPTLKYDKWSFSSTVVFAWADKTVPDNPNGSAPQKFYNHERRQFFNSATDNGGQSSFMGWEWDLGSKFRWDENFIIGWDLGMWFPGKYYAFANKSKPSDLLGSAGFMFASQIQAGITF